MRTRSTLSASRTLALMRANPTNYVIHFKKGAVVREGVGLAFLYYGPGASVTIQVAGKKAHLVVE